MTKVEIHPEAVEQVKKFTMKNDTNLGFGKHVVPIMIQAVYDDGKWKRVGEYAEESKTLKVTE